MNNRYYPEQFLNAIDMTVDDQMHSILNNSTNQQSQSDNIVCPLTNLGLLAIDGPDSAKFLQGQTTCDVAAVNSQLSTPGAYCNVKGRILSSFQLVQSEEHRHLLRMHESLVETTQSTLKKYIVFSKAEQSNASAQYCLLGFGGTAAKKNLSKLFKSLPTEINGSSIYHNNIVIQLDDEGTLFECWIDSSQVQTLWPTISANLELCGSRYWEQIAIRRGNAQLCNQTTGLFIPQMLNYDLTGAVSFTKGCYTGQEIVARMHYKGQSKRKLYRIGIAATHIAPGDDIYNAEGNQSLGNIVNVVTLDQDHSEALAVISSKDVEKSALFVGAERYKTELVTPAYAITNE